MWYKIKRIYQWTNLVRPYRFEYSYDFSNGSTSKMQTDGWTWYSWASFNADWIYCTWWHEYRVQPSGLSSIMSSANEIVFEITYKKNWTQNADYWCELCKDSSYDYNTWIYWNFQVIALFAWWTDLIGWTATISNWWHTIKAVFDLKNKVVNYDFPWVKTQTYSMTDWEIANIRACNKIFVPQHTYSYIKTISVKIK